MYVKVFIVTLLTWTTFSTASKMGELTPVREADNSANAERESADTVMDGIMLNQEDAKSFKTVRRGLNHECYHECCSWEEVREHYEHDIPAAKKYYENYHEWLKHNTCSGSSGW
ncbi:uncharacterized protein LOC114515680 [Dendronephthya gigantea]|uniref:uncharacterized protein LOC114515680 n=1 Tax=Dendronephthya gigantea TaxID=151771 RepID=UPI00106B523D|nr:uncharacterized protein LOC114515680 [Dendronephthya gigantea]XP_028390780.1 uncharacterized protein LOC114515680 [Dendronephthya gigantea]